MVPKPRLKQPGSAQKKRKRVESELDYDKTGSSGDDNVLDSDNLDESSDGGKAQVKRKQSKVRRGKRRKGVKSDGSNSELELKEGQQVVGKIVRAPETGQVPPGQVSRNTFDFLNQLTKAECNDREWFKLNDPVFRQAEKEWKSFIQVFTDNITNADPQIPHLPPRDVIHRIYRDVRFSNDKTPYKTNLSASFSRSGRKGIFAHYHMFAFLINCCIVSADLILDQPGNASLIAGGAWCPGKNELQTIRHNIQRSSARLRQIISSTEFTNLFGEARPHPQGQRRNVFGGEDELKVAPKGVDKHHPDIDLLKCRSLAVVHRFQDEVVLSPTFIERLEEIVLVLRPFVHCLNDMMTIQDPDPESSDEDDDE